jgi:hypothetical protein
MVDQSLPSRVPGLTSCGMSLVLWRICYAYPSTTSIGPNKPVIIETLGVFLALSLDYLPAEESDGGFRPGPNRQDS